MRRCLQVFTVVAAAGAIVPGGVQAGSFTVLGGMGDGNSIPHTAPDKSTQRIPVNLEKRLVDFAQPMAPGSIFISTSERALYFVIEGGKAWRYPVGVGREGFAWSGENIITRKAEWPDWRPPQEMITREARRGVFLPELMKGGPGNPLGARALYIGDTQYRIHGTSQPWSIGHAVSSGCIRMLNEQVVDLFNKVNVGARVIVTR